MALSVLRSGEEVNKINHIRSFGERQVIEGGLCIRRVEDFIADSERRYFVLNRSPYAAEPGAAIPEPVAYCAGAISSPFFSVDVARRADGVERIVEVGDGQVSDLVGWSVERFVGIWG
jgi:ATP-grasp domain, R2K clade family 3